MQAVLQAFLVGSVAISLATVVYAQAQGQTAQGKELMPLPPFLKGFVRQDCFEKFQLFDFSDVDCIKFTVSKLIGLAIVVGSGILKIPQILKIVSNSSVEGLSQLTLYIETTIFM